MTESGFQFERSGRLLVDRVRRVVLSEEQGPDWRLSVTIWSYDSDPDDRNPIATIFMSPENRDDELRLDIGGIRWSEPDLPKQAYELELVRASLSGLIGFAWDEVATSGHISVYAPEGWEDAIDELHFIRGDRRLNLVTSRPVERARPTA